LQLSGPDAALKILVIDENPIRRSIIESGLKEAGFTSVTVLSNTTRLIDLIYSLDPEVILIDLENPSRDVLEQMFQVSRVVRRPIAMFVDRGDKAEIEAAIDAGVSAYIVDGLKKERVKPILDMTISRFNAFHRLRAELEEAKSALKERKTIEKAKGKTAMSQGKRIGDIAQGLINAVNLLKE
jgi:two-component system, response regulator / RNA-binding antiterminator